MEKINSFPCSLVHIDESEQICDNFNTVILSYDIVYKYSCDDLKPHLLLPIIEPQKKSCFEKKDFDQCQQNILNFINMGHKPDEIISVICKHSSKLVNIDSVLNLLSAYLNAKFDIAPDKLTYANIVYREILTNAILHGNKGCDNKEVKVCLHILPNKNIIKLEVEDEGNGFDFEQTLNYINNEGDLRERHRGLYIIKSLSSGFSIDRNKFTAEIKF